MGVVGHFKKQDKEYESREGTFDASSLKDFYPYDTGLSQMVLTLEKEFKELAGSERRPCTREQFMALLGGISALRKTPGIPGPNQSDGDYFTTLPRCGSPEAEAECRSHLETVFGITDKDSLVEFCVNEICCHRQYQDFVGFWEGKPPFDLNRLNKGALEVFQTARNFSAQFYPIVGRQGYLAWDISECMGHLRSGYACGLLTRKELDEMAENWIAQARVFGNWAEFATSLICGELYWDFRGGSKLPELNKGLNLWSRLIHILLEDNTAWGSDMWYCEL